MNPNKFHMSGTFFKGGSLKCYQSKTILKFFFYAAYICFICTTPDKENGYCWSDAFPKDHTAISFFPFLFQNMIFDILPITCLLSKMLHKAMCIQDKEITNIRGVVSTIPFKMKTLKQCPYIYIYIS